MYTPGAVSTEQKCCSLGGLWRATGRPVASPVYKMSSIFFIGGLFLESRSGGAPSSFPNLDTIPEQYL